MCVQCPVHFLLHTKNADACITTNCHQKIMSALLTVILWADYKIYQHSKSQYTVAMLKAVGLNDDAFVCRFDYKH